MATPYDTVALVLRAPLGLEVKVIDATPMIAGRPEADVDPLEVHDWAIEKHADAEQVVNVVCFPTDAEARAWAAETYGVTA